MSFVLFFFMLMSLRLIGWKHLIWRFIFSISYLPPLSINLLPTTNYFTNPLPTLTLLDHLCVFGCLCFPHTVTSHKLSPRTTSCVFLGYPSQHRRFRCLNLANNKIIISRHVIFDETSFPFGSMTPDQPPSYSFLDHATVDPNIFSSRFARSLGPTIDTSSPSTSTLVHTSQPDPPSPPTSPSPLASPPLATAPTDDVVPVPPPSTSHHPTATCSHHVILKPITRLYLHAYSTSPLPKSYSQAFSDPN